MYTNHSQNNDQVPSGIMQRFRAHLVGKNKETNMRKPLNAFFYPLLLGFFSLYGLTACSTLDKKNTFTQPSISKPLRTQQAAQTPAQHEILPNRQNPPTTPAPPRDQPDQRFQTTPIPPSSAPQIFSGGEQQQPVFRNQQPITINVDNLPLPAFINEVYGNLLGLNFQISQALQDKTDLVTLRVTQPQSPQQFYQIVLRVLANYGIGIVLQDSVLHFMPAAEAATAEPPLLVSGRTLPSVPVTHRPVFQHIQLKNVQIGDVTPWIGALYENQKIQTIPDLKRNAIIIKGAPNIVKQAASVIEMFDRPLMRGRHTIAIRPNYLGVTQLADGLEKILTSEGYQVARIPTSSYPIVVLPIEQSRLLLIFSSDPVLAQHVRNWVKHLDVPPPSRPPVETRSLFYYQVQNTTAEELLATLNPLLVSGILDTSSPNTTTSKLTLDKSRNSLIFYGFNHEWKKLLNLLKQLDQAPRMVLIEVIIAEVTLTDEYETGIEWLLRDAGVGSFDGALGTLTGTSSAGLGLGGRGLTYYPISNSGNTLAALNAFASTNRVSILSKPHIMVRSGESASISVGSEVPIVTSNTTGNTQLDGNTTILQQVQYRRTGVNLQVTPTVYSGNQIALKVQQEVSQAEANNTSNINSPIILTRNLNTSLSLSDGGSVLLGGQISTNQTEGKSGIPLLSDIPILGNLFKVKKQNRVRTEMLMLIIPYIINDPRQAQEITDIFRQQLQQLPISETPPDAPTPAPAVIAP